jgi:large subunit ribosomal protein L36e
MGNKATAVKKASIQKNTTEQKSIAIGLNKGHVTTEIKKTEKQAKLVPQARKKGRAGRRVRLVRQIVSEVCGLSGYEKRVIELLKTGNVKDNKKALKVSKKALGTHKRGKAKREALQEYLRNLKKK